MTDIRFLPTKKVKEVAGTTRSMLAIFWGIGIVSVAVLVANTTMLVMNDNLYFVSSSSLYCLFNRVLLSVM